MREAPKILTLVLALAAVGPSDTAHSQCLRYTVQIYNPQTCWWGHPGIGVTNISDAGEICGGGGTCRKLESAGYAWFGGASLYYLPMPPGLFGLPLDINSKRQIAGKLTDSDFNLYRAFLFQDGVTSELGMLSGHYQSEAMGITEDGVVCGTSWSPLGGSNAVIWHNGQITAIDLPMGPYKVAFGISDNHLVCGWMGEADTTVAHAFIHDLNAGQTTDIGTPLAATTNAQATSVNNLGNVCGWSFSTVVTGGRRGFFWSQGQVQEIYPLAGFPRVTAMSLNDSNLVVGDSATSTGVSRAFIWQEGTTRALQDLISTTQPLSIETVAAINKAGQITAEGRLPNPSGPGFITVALRLNPVPPLTGDLNCDWQVNVPDLLAVIGAWGPCPSKPPGEPFTETCHADFNDDGVVNHHDIVAVVLNWTS